jgi:hypothetical protein
MYDWHGYLQWRPKITNKPTTWYVMGQWGIDPQEMADRFHAEIENMIKYQVAYEVEGEWQKETKRMKITGLVGPVG